MTMRPRVTYILLQWSIFASSTLTILSVPSQDEWRKPPTGWQDALPGSVLKMRSSAFSMIPLKNAIDSFQILYRTTDTLGRPSWAVTTVFIPASHASCTSKPDTCSHGLVSYEVAYNSVNNDASPSWTLQFGELQGEYGEIGRALSRGWFVNVPDFEGPLASYTAGMQEGYATLDSVRASMEVSRLTFGLKQDAKVALWGYSGGGQAVAYAAELAASYAPELKIAGAVAGGLLPNISNSLDLLNNRDVAGLVVGCLLGITAQHPQVYATMLNRIKVAGPQNITGFLTPYYMYDLISMLSHFAGQDVWAYWPNGKADAFTPAVAEIYEADALLGFHGMPNMPIFIYKATGDNFSIDKETDDLVTRYCAGGANVLYHKNDVGGHTDEITNGRQRALYFLSAVLDGNTGLIDIPKTGCSTKHVSEKADLVLIA